MSEKAFTLPLRLGSSCIADSSNLANSFISLCKAIKLEVLLRRAICLPMSYAFLLNVYRASGIYPSRFLRFRIDLAKADSGSESMYSSSMFADTSLSTPAKSNCVSIVLTKAVGGTTPVVLIEPLPVSYVNTFSCTTSGSFSNSLILRCMWALVVNISTCAWSLSLLRSAFNSYTSLKLPSRSSGK